MNTIVNVFLIFFLCKCSSGYVVEPGPAVKATKGEVWPHPQDKETFETFFTISPEKFEFRAINETCSILDNAFKRYMKIIENLSKQYTKKYLKNDEFIQSGINSTLFSGYIDILQVNMIERCTEDSVPSLEMDEQYTLNITKNTRLLEAKTIWGVLRGLETFSQLLYTTAINEEVLLIVKATYVSDFPRFPHRGLLLDTSRHYLPLTSILETLDAMSYNKMNVFHWHIVDDQSFPYQSDAFPELSKFGAYDQSKVYTKKNIQEVINYARQRGIRVIPEFDTPGHTRSWGQGIPNLLTPCYFGNSPIEEFGPIDPTKNSSYIVVEKLFKEVINAFPDKYVHIGGDEVDFDCWKSNPKIQAFMKLIPSNNYQILEDYFIKRVINMVQKFNATAIVWEEVFVNGIKLPSNVIVQVWKPDDYKYLMNKITQAGLPVLLSSCWYLDNVESGGDWQKFYSCEPSFRGKPRQLDLLLGGEACMWGESVNEYNLIQRVWPRASAVAEKLWSARSVQPINQVERRLEEHTCRMNQRGIGAQPPNGPGACIY